MSNALAIAAVTATLRNLLQSISNITGLNDTRVTTQPPDEARINTNPNQLNLFLYQVLPNAAWRNMDIPQQVRSGETAMPPLALNLYYMLTAYGIGNNDVLGHSLLGHAMSILYDHSLLGSQEIQVALQNDINLPADSNSELQNQVERLRITLQPLSVEEIFRLWSGFQSQYRVSVAYEAAVVLIDSRQPRKTPLPVLTRGKDDRGITSQADPIPFPTLVTVSPPNKQGSIRLGEILTIDGFHLNVKNLTVRFALQHLGLTQILVPEAGATANELTIKIPEVPNDWAAGFYTVAVGFTNDDGNPATTNELPISLAPRIDKLDPTVVKDANNVITDVTIKVHFSPVVRPGQRVSFLFADREILAPSLTAATQDLTFDVGAIPTNDYVVRLRVDGVDSLPFNPAVSPPKFDDSQKVTIS